MMQSHSDRDFDRQLFARFPKTPQPTAAEDWMSSLEEKANRMAAAGESQITGGSEDEQPLAEWQHKTVHVRHMPPDEHGILRISIGGGENIPVKLDYCVFRGNRGECIDLLRRALKAMESR